jgi:hypothetical protein
MLGNYRVAAQFVASRAVLSSTELISYERIQKWYKGRIEEFLEDSNHEIYSRVTPTESIRSHTELFRQKYNKLYGHNDEG